MVTLVGGGLYFLSHSAGGRRPSAEEFGWLNKFGSCICLSAHVDVVEVSECRKLFEYLLYEALEECDSRPAIKFDPPPTRPPKPPN
jgi:hypothetical protein